ncbi:MAG TPA: sigma-70 family RNA polymerase sigma factor [Spirochaetia bacterium]|nr:sigma-70 family RNA polymerase sigma factor [Spirochaetia bacterium]
MQSEDRKLVRLWCAGDPDAFTALILKHEKLMRRIAVVTAGSLATQDEMLVDDIIQAACMRLLDALRRYRGTCEPATYIAGVVRICALDAVRKQVRYENETMHIADELSFQKLYQSDIADDIITKLENKKIFELLAKIPEPERSLLYLQEAEQIGLKELSKMFAMPLGTVKSKLSRAKKKFRSLIGKETLT